MPADGFAISRKDHATLLDATGMRERGVHRAHGFFIAATARTGDAGDAHAQRAADVAANAFGQRDRHLRWRSRWPKAFAATSAARWAWASPASPVRAVAAMKNPWARW